MKNTLIKQLITLYKRCKKSDTIFLLVLFRAFVNIILYKKVLLLHQKVTINGVRNIETNDILEIGIKPRGFLHKSDKTYLNIKGKLKIKGLYSIGRGCRFDIGENAIVSIGSGGYMTSNVTLIIMHNLIIGDNCAIAWNIQFLDDNFHTIEYAGKKESKNSIEIGNNVWIGCGVKIYKGTIIPNGCVIASDSIVKGSYLKENCLIAGNPAKIIKENVKWDDKELPS